MTYGARYTGRPSIHHHVMSLTARTSSLYINMEMLDTTQCVTCHNAPGYSACLQRNTLLSTDTSHHVIEHVEDHIRPQPPAGDSQSY
ncbi:hypothetical protein HaLaN_12854 [Haematococcus lacustris]|uniref:Uncharacterized protein n=1 Tax=Haematococcus lacustris TaxID=44745 RepID=A0A699ZC10_HAELA|nr:hypothetical protein HaLaN_12854 [Haematococcus lacustris]